MPPVLNLENIVILKIWVAFGPSFTGFVWDVSLLPPDCGPADPLDNE